MSFKNKFPLWNNEGTEPPESLQNEGFQGGQKPPAAWLNWLTSLTKKCIDELQGKIVNNEVYKANSVDGVAFTATIDGVTELYEGLELSIIPYGAGGRSNDTATLKVNDFSAAPIVRVYANSFRNCVDVPSKEIESTVAIKVKYSIVGNDLMDFKWAWVLMDKPKISATDADAAPSGYVEEYIEVNTAADFNAKVAELENAMDIRTTRYYGISKKDHENEFPQCDYFVEINKSYHGFSTVIAKGLHNGNAFTLRRALFDNTWGEWEWDNPILYYGVEYLTTEKWKGVPVYTKLINSDPLTEGKNTVVNSTGGITAIVKYAASIGAIPLPYLPNGLDATDGFFATVGVQDDNIYLNVGSALSGRSAEIQIWYTKT